MSKLENFKITTNMTRKLAKSDDQLKKEQSNLYKDIAKIILERKIKTANWIQRIILRNLK